MCVPEGEAQAPIVHPQLDGPAETIMFECQKLSHTINGRRPDYGRNNRMRFSGREIRSGSYVSRMMEFRVAARYSIPAVCEEISLMESNWSGSVSLVFVVNQSWNGLELIKMNTESESSLRNFSCYNLILIFESNIPLKST